MGWKNTGSTAGQCHSCTSPIEEGQRVCDCGAPTSFMTFDERREWETARWRARKDQLSA